MKFTANQTDLLVLGHLARQTSKMFPNIKIEATSNDVLTCSASDGIISMQAKVKCIDGQGSCLIEGKKFYELISKLSGKINFDNGIIKSGKSKFKLPIVEDVANFLEIAEVTGETKTIETKEFLGQLRKTVFATSNDTSNILGGVSVNGSDLAATNGNILALNKLTTDISVDAILPKMLCDELIKCFNDVDEFDVINDRIGITFSTPDFTLTSRLIEGTYPKYQQLIPTSTATNVTLDKQQILDALDLLSIVKNERTNVCVLEFDNNNLKITASNADNGEGAIDLDIDYAFEPLKIAFNMEYLKGIFKNVCNDDVFELGLNNSLAAALIKNGDDVALVMPVQVK